MSSLQPGTVCPPPHCCVHRRPVIRQGGARWALGVSGGTGLEGTQSSRHSRLFGPELPPWPWAPKIRAAGRDFQQPVTSRNPHSAPRPGRHHPQFTDEETEAREDLRSCPDLVGRRDTNRGEGGTCPSHFPLHRAPLENAEGTSPEVTPQAFVHHAPQPCSAWDSKPSGGVSGRLSPLSVQLLVLAQAMISWSRD